jgi:hypothetical protein
VLLLLDPLSHASVDWTLPSPQYCGVPATVVQLRLHREQLVDGYGHSVLLVLLDPLSHCSDPSLMPLPQLAVAQSFPLQPMVPQGVVGALHTPPEHRWAAVFTFVVASQVWAAPQEELSSRFVVVTWHTDAPVAHEVCQILQLVEWSGRVQSAPGMHAPQVP